MTLDPNAMSHRMGAAYTLRPAFRRSAPSTQSRPKEETSFTVHIPGEEGSHREAR